MSEEILVIKKKASSDKMKAKVTYRRTNSWSPSNYENSISKNANDIALFLNDLKAMGFPIDKAIEKYRQMLNEPESFFLK